MSIGIVGGIKGIEREYINIAKKHNIKIKIFNQYVPEFCKRIKNLNAVILCTGTTSHKMSCTCCNLCKKNDIQVERIHSSSLNSLENAILKIKNGGI